MIIFLIAFAAILVAKKLRIWRFDLQSYGFLLVVCASMHLVFMYFYYDLFAIISDGFYLAVSSACLFSLIIGVKLGESVAAHIKVSWWKNSRSAEVMAGFQYVILGFVLLVSVVNVASYVQTTGTINPFVGLRSYLSGENSAEEMWATAGALRYGDGRGVGDGGGNFLSYLLARFSLLIYLLLGVLRPYVFAVGAGAYFLTDLLALSVGYFSRTVVLLRAGVLALYGDAKIYKFKPILILSLLGLGFIGFLVLHLGRTGDLVQQGSGLVGKPGIAALETAAVGTFEPIGFAFRYYSAFGANSFEENIEHFGSYAGAVVPRFFWAEKPYYALEPDMTMKLTQQNIGGVNVVRTFSLIGEGLMIGGVWGVAFISLLYGLLTSFTLGFLSQRPEFVVVRIYLLLMFVLGFRLSLFTVWTSTFVLGLLPLAVVWSCFNFALPGRSTTQESARHVANRARNTQ